MSTPFFKSIENFGKHNATESKLINLAWSTISAWYTGAVFLGCLLITILVVILLTNTSIRTGAQSRSNIIILGWVGFGLIVFGLWMTINSFYNIVYKINENIVTNGPYSLFSEETAVTAAELVASEYNMDRNVKNYVNQRKFQLSGSREKFNKPSVNASNALLKINSDEPEVIRKSSSPLFNPGQNAINIVKPSGSAFSFQEGHDVERILNNPAFKQAYNEIIIPGFDKQTGLNESFKRDLLEQIKQPGFSEAFNIARQRGDLKNFFEQLIDGLIED